MCITDKRREDAIRRGFVKMVDGEELIQRAKEYLASKEYTPTLKELLKEIKCSSKTWNKVMKEKEMTYTGFLNQLGISTKHKRSKFSQKVLCLLSEIYQNHTITEEKTFDDLVNDKTGHKLRLDFYIEELKIAIECDGKQHHEIEHYFNKKTIENGHTPSYITDKLKEEYCLKNKIKLIRIPYHKNVTMNYIKKYI